MSKSHTFLIHRVSTDITDITLSNDTSNPLKEGVKTVNFFTVTEQAEAIFI